MGLLARVGRIIEQLGQIQWKYSDPTVPTMVGRAGPSPKALLMDRRSYLVSAESSMPISASLTPGAFGGLPSRRGNALLLRIHIGCGHRKSSIEEVGM